MSKTNVSADIRARDFGLAIFIGCLLVLPGLWAYTLIDPWEGHYAEVARRILADEDWVRLSWQSEVFRSKPALTPWLIAASMKVHGLATDGGFSGEMVVSPGFTAWVVRLPFALCGIAGMLSMWWMLAKLVSRRAAYLGLVTLGCIPFYLLVARQAITDMPMVAATSSAMCFFMLAMHDGERLLTRVVWRIRIHHVALFVVALITLCQMLYNVHYFLEHRQLGLGMKGTQAVLWVSIPFVLGISILLILCLLVWPMRVMRDFYMLCTYALIGVSVLAKGPPGVVLAVLVALLYLLSAGRLRMLWKLRIIEGVIVIALVALPWHLAMALRDGLPFLVEYVGHHWLKRAGAGVHMVNRAGEGSFTYFVKELGYGLWPFLCVLPAAIWAAWCAGGSSPSDHLRRFALLWSVVGLVLFTVLKTKYHHYILPVVPGVALMIALWFEGIWSRRYQVNRSAIAFGVILCGMVGYDIFGRQARLLELFSYRYDRLWPAADPWNVDLSIPLAFFGVLFCLVGTSMFWRRFSGVSLLAALGLSVAFGFFVGNCYMSAIAPHWGQGQLHRRYYEERKIYGITLQYHSLDSMRQDWAKQRDTVGFRSLVPQAFEQNTTMKIRLISPSISHDLMGRVTDIDGENIIVTLNAGPPVLGVAETSTLGSRAPEVSVDADPLIAWNLHWRSELFWSGGELWNSLPGGHRMFRQGHDADFLKLIEKPSMQDRTIYVLTELGQGRRLRKILNDEESRQTLEIVSQSNKFTLYRFVRR